MKRLFAEINLEGFDSSFNKSDVVDKAGLDSLIEKLVEQIKQESENILKMGAEYRVSKPPRGPKPQPTPLPPAPPPAPKPPESPPTPKLRHTIILIGACVFDVKEGKSRKTYSKYSRACLHQLEVIFSINLRSRFKLNQLLMCL